MQIVTNEELEQLKLNGEKILVDFYADWCGPCKMLMPRLETMESEYPNVKFVKLNVDHSKDYTVSMGIRSVPTVVFFDGTKLINQSSGIQSDGHYKTYLSQLNGNNE